MFCCCRRHAHIDLASEFDVEKVLKLNGAELLGRPMKICKAKVKGDKVEKKATAEEKRGNGALQHMYTYFLTTATVKCFSFFLGNWI